MSPPFCVTVTRFVDCAITCKRVNFWQRSTICSLHCLIFDNLVGIQSFFSRNFVHSIFLSTCIVSLLIPPFFFSLPSICLSVCPSLFLSLSLSHLLHYFNIFFFFLFFAFTHILCSSFFYFQPVDNLVNK